MIVPSPVRVSARSKLTDPATAPSRNDGQDDQPPVLLERLGPNLNELGLPVDDVLQVVATTLRSFWRPVDRQVSLPTGAEKAAWLAALIVATWEQ